MMDVVDVVKRAARSSGLGSRTVRAFVPLPLHPRSSDFHIRIATAKDSLRVDMARRSHTWLTTYLGLGDSFPVFYEPSGSWVFGHTSSSHPSHPARMPPSANPSAESSSAAVRSLNFPAATRLHLTNPRARKAKLESLVLEAMAQNSKLWVLIVPLKARSSAHEAGNAGARKVTHTRLDCSSPFITLGLATRPFL